MASIALSSLPGGSNSAAFAPGDLKKMKDGFMSCEGIVEQRLTGHFIIEDYLKR